MFLSRELAKRTINSACYRQLARVKCITRIEKYKQRILKKTKLTEQEFQEFVFKLLSNVTVIPNLLISRASLKHAYQLCQGIDEKDTVYVTVALEFDVTLITSDKTLYTGLKKRNFTQVMLLRDVIDTLPVIQ